MIGLGVVVVVVGIINGGGGGACCRGVEVVVLGVVMEVGEVRVAGEWGI